MGELDGGVESEQYKKINIRKCFQVYMAYLYPTAHLPLKAMHGDEPDENFTHSIVHTDGEGDIARNEERR